jgi:hypothetical protein
LRLALLLLDNAAEVQLARCVQSEMAHELMQERIRERVLEIPSPPLDGTLKELVDWQPLDYKEKNSLLRQFDEKVRFLTGRAKKLDSRLGAPLCHLHRYRNEAYHEAHVRRDTVSTATRLLLEINCEMLLTLTRGWTSYASNEDYSWLGERFGENCIRPMNHDGLVPRAVEEFRASASLDDTSVRRLLAEHMTTRLDEVTDGLRFIVENTRCPEPETAIRDSFGFNMARRKREGLPIKDLSQAENRHTTSFIQNARQRVSDVSAAQDRLEAFHRFGQLETEFEPVEESVHVLVGEVDAMIQLQIDIARGK